MNSQQVKRLKKMSEDPLYLIDYKIELNKELLEFHISGSTKNIYMVKITDTYVDCDCPDSRSWAKKFKVCCKHVCFVLFKVVKVFSENNNLVLDWNKQNTSFFTNLKLSPEEYKYIKSFLEAKKVSTDVINQSLVDKYNKISTQDPNDMFKHSVRVLDPQDDCPICYDVFGIDIQNLLSCLDCQNYVHTNCMNKWLEHNTTCVYCRSECWSKLKDNKSGKYINLS